MASYPKVVVIGLDGATFDLLGPWLEAGYLPHLRRIIHEGSAGELESTLPPVTAPAWTSFQTGSNPGRHGVYDWQGPLRGTLNRPLLTSRAIKAPKLWHFLNAQGQRVGILNVPFTYPPDAVDGFMVSGMLTPSMDTPFTWPTELRSTISKVKGYRIDLDLNDYPLDDPAPLLRDAADMIDARSRAALALLRTHQIDLFMVVFIAPDRIQHRLWHLMDPTHPSYDEDRSRRYLPSILRCYSLIDDFVRQIDAVIPPQTSLLVVSDHGFGPLTHLVDMTKWLEQEGLLRLHPGRALPLRLFPGLHLGLGLRRLALRTIRRMARPANFSEPLGETRPNQRRPRIHELIQWPATRAYPGNATEQALYLNIKGREPMGIVEPGEEYESVRDILSQRLLDLRDPASGEPLVAEIFKREEIYNGPYVEDAPDILFTLARGYQAIEAMFDSAQWINPIRPEIQSNWGRHERKGILIAKGELIAKGGRVRAAKITDLLPTILHLMGLPIPTTVDGRVLEDILDSSFRQANRVTYSDYAQLSLPLQETEEKVAEDEAEIRERLRGLGYIS